MAKLLKLRRGTTTQHGSFTGELGEVTVDTDKTTLVVHPGGTEGGGEALLREDLNNMPNSGVTAGTYGSSSAIPAITVDAKGLVTSATTSAIDSTSIANGTSSVSVIQDGNIQFSRGGTNQLEVDGSGLLFQDGKKIRMGGSADLQIYHDGSNSYIQDAGTGSLTLATDGANIALQKGSTETLAIFKTDGACELYHDNSKKLETTSNGIDVTGSVTCDNILGGSQGYDIGSGTGNGDIFLNNGTTDTPGVMFYYGNNTNFGIDATINNGLRFVRNLNESGGILCAAIDTNGYLVPGANNTFDLGTSSLRWRNVYTNDLNLSNEGGTNDVDGTWGSWTIQEGEDDLFLLNRRNGKKYKFNLSEVN